MRAENGLKMCSKCREVKAIEDFHRNRSAVDGLHPQCKACHLAGIAARRKPENQRKYDAAYRERNREKDRERKRDYMRRESERLAAYREQYKAEHPERVKAGEKLRRRLRHGLIVKPGACEECGRTDLAIHGHHDDYSKPYEVRWLCASCHRTADDARRAKEETNGVC